MRNRKGLILAAGLLVSAAIPALAQQQPALTGDPKEAHKKIAICEGCHGIAGYKTCLVGSYQVFRQPVS